MQRQDDDSKSERTMAAKLLVLDDETLTLVRKQEELFDSMMENAIAGDALPKTINIIKTYQDAILKKDSKDLSERREKIQSQLKLSTYAMLLSKQQSEIENIKIIITAINTLLNDAYHISLDDLYKMHEMQKKGFVEAGHVINTINQNQKIDDFVKTIKPWLERLNDKVNTTKWKVKNVLGCWVDGIPDHIVELQNVLAKMDFSIASRDILHIYSEVINIFSNLKESDKRHSLTSYFDTIKMREYQSINFYNSASFQQVCFPFTIEMQCSNSSAATKSMFQTQASSHYYPATTLSSLTQPSPFLPPYSQPSFEYHGQSGMMNNIVGMNDFALIKPTLPPLRPEFSHHEVSHTIADTINLRDKLDTLSRSKRKSNSDDQLIFLSNKTGKPEVNTPTRDDTLLSSVFPDVPTQRISQSNMFTDNSLLGDVIANPVSQGEKKKKTPQHG